MKLIYLLLPVICLTSAFGQAKVLSEKELFESGLQAYRSKSYPESKNKFETQIKEYPEGSLYTAGLLMLSKTFVKMQYLKKSIVYTDKLITSFPGSSYVDDALFIKAESFYGLDDYVSSVKALSSLRKLQSNKQISLQADSLIRMIAENNLTSDNIRNLMAESSAPEDKQILQTQYISNLLEQKRYGQAERFLEALLKKESSSSRIKIYRDILKKIDAKDEGPVRIGFITSLSGANSEVGRSIKAGGELAVNEYNRSNTPRIELAIYDDQSDILQAIQAAKELTADDGISAIIGPIESNAMAAAAVIAEQRHIPIISPTATKSGLSQIGDYVYQANVNMESRSEAIARYAIEELKLKKCAILTPSDSYGDIAATAFAKTVEKLGGKIIVIEKFYDNTTDYKGQLVHLRKMGFIEKALPQTSYRALSKLTSFQIDSVYAQYYPIDSTSTESEYNIPMDYIDAVFLPVYTDDIKYIAPQIAFYNIKTQLLGGDNWNDLTELRLHQNYVNGVMFVSESFMDPNDAAIRSFNETFRKANGSMPSRDAAYGFDVINMLTSVIQSGYYSSEEIQAELKKGVSWQGIHNKIIFTKDSRVNSSVHLLQFSNGKISKLSD